jgi:hypothetical protein
MAAILLGGARLVFFLGGGGVRGGEAVGAT